MRRVLGSWRSRREGGSGVTGRLLAAAALGLAAAALLPGAAAAQGERAYELVTPSGTDMRIVAGGGEATPDGNVVCFNAEHAVPGVPSNGTLTAADGYCARRTESGWNARWVTGPSTAEDWIGVQGSQVFWVSPDGARAVFASDAGIYPDYRGDGPGGSTPGTLSAFMWEGGDMPRWLAPIPATPDPEPEYGGNGTLGFTVKRDPVAASEDLRYGVFWSSNRLLPGDTNDVLDAYRWTPDGIDLVSSDADGNAVGGSLPFGFSVYQKTAQPGGISRDGSRIFFHHSGPLAGGAPADVQSVFLREGDDTRLVSPRRGPGPAQDVHFAGASEDGEIVFLSTAEQLTDDPKGLGSAIYRYDLSSDALTLVASSPTDDVNFMDVSADGSTIVYKVGASFADHELFVQRNGVATSLGVLPMIEANFEVLQMAGSPRHDNRPLRMSPDGSEIVFASTAGLAGTAPGLSQVYRWTPSDGVRNISARSPEAPAGDAVIGNFNTSLPTKPRHEWLLHNMRGNPNLGRVLAEDGRVYFETPERLVDGDVNDFIDVYEWGDGVVRLISPGTQQAHAFYHDNSADGDTVFFFTSARVIPELDRNVSHDLYAARVGGGFPLPDSAGECEGDRCQGELPAHRGGSPPASTAIEGSGNVRARPPLRARLAVPRLSAGQRAALARRGRTALRVRASAKGLVTVTATARVGRRTVRVATARRTVTGRSAARLPLRLTKRARSALAAKGRLRVTIVVSHARSKRAARQVVVLHG